MYVFSENRFGSMHFSRNHIYKCVTMSLALPLANLLQGVCALLWLFHKFRQNALNLTFNINSLL